MKALNYFLAGKGINPTLYSTSFKTCVTLFETVVGVGELHNIIFMDKYFKEAKYETKLKVMKNNFVNPADDEACEAMKKFEDTHKSFKTIKHPPSHIIGTYKKMQSIFLNWYNESLQMMIDNFKEAGMFQLNEICEEDYIKVYIVRSILNDDSINKDDTLTIKNYLLQNYPNEDFELPLVVLSTDFFGWMLNESIDFVDADSHEALDNEQIYLQKILSYPNVHALNPTQVVDIRNSIKDITKPFNDAINNWLENFDNFRLNSDKISFIKEEIKPLCNSIQAAINQHPLTEYANSVTLNKKAELLVYIGEIPKPIYYQFYYNMGHCTEEEYNDLMNLYTNNFEQRKRIPCVVISFSKEALKAEKETEEVEEIEAETFQRKTISID